jgi:hypothetical protein
MSVEKGIGCGLEQWRCVNSKLLMVRGYVFMYVLNSINKPVTKIKESVLKKRI